MVDLSLQLHQQAIHAALQANWKEAINLNKQIIETDPKNVDALNRLARALFEVGEISSSKKHYEQALEIDPYNQIAFKFLKKIEACSKRGDAKRVSNGRAHPQISVELFIEEPGKTKLINLLKLAEPQKLSLLCPGELVTLVPKSRGIVVTDQYDEYLGVLPDDISHQMTRLINGGNKYQALVRNIKTNSLTIIIREIHRSARFKNQASFLDNVSGHMAYSSDSIIVQDDSEDSPTEDEDSNEIV